MNWLFVAKVLLLHVGWLSIAAATWAFTIPAPWNRVAGTAWVIGAVALHIVPFAQFARRTPAQSPLDAAAAHGVVTFPIVGAAGITLWPFLENAFQAPRVWEGMFYMQFEIPTVEPGYREFAVYLLVYTLVAVLLVVASSGTALDRFGRMPSETRELLRLSRSSRASADGTSPFARQ
jgi:hypothetical protein